MGLGLKNARSNVTLSLYIPMYYYVLPTCEVMDHDDHLFIKYFISFKRPESAGYKSHMSDELGIFLGLLHCFLLTALIDLCG